MNKIISESNITIEGKEFSGRLYARKMHPDGRPYHTFRTYTLLVDGNDVTFRKCVFSNTAGPGEAVGQAIALYLDGDDIKLFDCVLKGHQDTLFLAPLPEKEFEKDGFLGPKQFAERKRRKYYFENCLIEGGVDFVFGGGECVFSNCEFKSVEAGYVFAPSTPKGQEIGFLCEDCTFTHSDGVSPESTYLGRPWREYARVTLKNCFLGDHIKKEGWHDWGKQGAHANSLFIEEGSRGPGAEGAARPDWVRFS